jgi:uncharacterized RDD family membrane protein YckC
MSSGGYTASMVEELIFCSRCGAQNGISASFCQRCGSSLIPAGMPAMPVPAMPSHAPAIPVNKAAYGGFWIRFLALFIDAMVLGAVLYPMFFAFAVAHGWRRYDWEGVDMVHFALVASAARLFSIVVSWLYEALMLSSSWQGTLGKRALGLRVTDEYGQRITFMRATGRHFAKYLSWITLCIGFIMVVFTERRQALHDFIAGTLVRRDSQY